METQKPKTTRAAAHMEQEHTALRGPRHQTAKKLRKKTPKK